MKINESNSAPIFINGIKNLSGTSYINEVTYRVNLLRTEFNRFSCDLRFRVEDELTTEETYQLLKDVTFFDIEFNYKIGSFSISTSIENLLNFNNKEFAIEPSLERHFNIIEKIVFSHEPDFLINTSISYNF